MALRALASFAAAAAVGVYLLACHGDTVTSREHAVMHGESAVVRAQATGANHRWDVDVALRDAPEGTYVMLYSSVEPSATKRLAIAESDPILKCPTGRARGALPQLGCTVADHGEVIAVAQIGPGGAGALRAAFDGGSGGYFTVVRADSGRHVSTNGVPLDVHVVSEAITKDDEAQRFAIEQRR